MVDTSVDSHSQQKDGTATVALPPPLHHATNDAPAVHASPPPARCGRLQDYLPFHMNDSRQPWIFQERRRDQVSRHDFRGLCCKFGLTE
jgi:hypothetical protein